MSGNPAAVIARRRSLRVPSRSRRGSTSSLPPSIQLSPSSPVGSPHGHEMENYASKEKEGVQQLHVDYIDRRSGSSILDPDCIPSKHTDRPSIISTDRMTAEEDENRRPTAQRQTSYTPDMQEKLQRKLKFFFMNPIEKWRAKGRFPWKLGIQIVKLIIVTTQLVIFAQYISEHVSRREDTKLSLRHIFLKDWSSARDLKTYPPNAGLYAVFTKSEFHDHINYAVKQFASLDNVTIAPFSYDDPHGELTPMKFCKTYYKVGTVWSFNDSFQFNSAELKECVAIEPDDLTNPHFNIQEFLHSKNFSISFSRLKHAKLEFRVKSVFLKSLKPWDLPDCYTFVNSIVFENANHDGLIAIDLQSIFIQRTCHGNILYADSSKEQTILDDLLVSIVIVMCSLSLVLCSRALYRAYQLQKETTTFFKKYLNEKLPMTDRSEFLNLWYITILINDILIILGSVLKLLLAHYYKRGVKEIRNFSNSPLLTTHDVSGPYEQEQTTDSELYTTCTMALGIGNLLMWAGVLRYFGFFSKYNILILTLKNALPDVLRFVMCAMFLYCGYCVCGWLVLGPYHFKFQTLAKTTQCLFSLINGDDMFATFQMVSGDANNAIWWFSQIYLYSFIILFIYVVLSLFIGIINESYELIKEYYEHGFPKSRLMEFIAQYNDGASINLYRRDMPMNGTCASCLNCLRCRSDISDESYEEIIGASDY